MCAFSRVTVLPVGFPFSSMMSNISIVVCAFLRLSAAFCFEFILHLCAGFSRDAGVAVHDARAGDLVVAVFLPDRIECRVQFPVAFFVCLLYTSPSPRDA